MIRMFRTAATIGATVFAIGALSGCAFFQPVERFSDEAAITDAIATIEIDDPKGAVVINGDDDATELTVSRTVSYRGERPEDEDHDGEHHQPEGVDAGEHGRLEDPRGAQRDAEDQRHDEGVEDAVGEVVDAERGEHGEPDDEQRAGGVPEGGGEPRGRGQRW